MSPDPVGGRHNYPVTKNKLIYHARISKQMKCRGFSEKTFSFFRWSCKHSPAICYIYMCSVPINILEYYCVAEADKP